METATWLLIYGGALGWGLDSVLARAGWLRRSPRVGLWFCHATGLGVLMALSLAMVLLAHDVMEHGLAWLLDADKALLHAAYAEPQEIPRYWNASALLLLMGVAALTTGASKRFHSARRTSEAHRIAASAALPITTADGFKHILNVCRSSVPAIYCLAAGRPNQRIHVTTAALRALGDRELRAAVEHEQGHLRRRHHLMALFAQAVRVMLRWTAMLRHYPDTVNELVELDADDFAAARHGPRVVAAALLRMGTAGSATAPGSAMSWTGSDPAARIRRLMSTGDRRLPHALTSLLISAAVALPLVPVTVSLAPALAVAGSAEGSASSESERAPAFVHHP